MKIVDPAPEGAEHDAPQRTAQVLRFNGVTKLDLHPEVVITSALVSDLQAITIIGLRSDGTEYFASSIADGADVLWMIERAKMKLLRIVDENDE